MRHVDAIHNSLVPIHYSLVPIHNSLIPIHNSLNYWNVNNVKKNNTAQKPQNLMLY